LSMGDPFMDASFAAAKAAAIGEKAQAGPGITTDSNPLVPTLEEGRTADADRPALSEAAHMTPPVSHVTSWASRPGLKARASRAARRRHSETAQRPSGRPAALTSTAPPAIETTTGGW